MGKTLSEKKVIGTVVSGDECDVFAKDFYYGYDVREAIKKEMKIFEECRDETDIWGDEERWNKFEKMFKKRRKEEAFGKELCE